MIDPLLRFGLPLAIAGTGVSTVLGVSTSSTNKNDLFPNTSLVLSSSETSKQMEMSSPIKISESSLEVAVNYPKNTDSIKEVEQEIETVQQLEKTGNCKVISDLDEVMREMGLSSSHISVSCAIQGEESYNVLGEEWTGLLPKSLWKLINREFIVDSKLAIDVVTTDIETEDEDFSGEGEGERAEYKTVFTSQEFIRPVTGEWGFGDNEVKDKRVDSVKLIDPENKENIYFVH